MSIDDLITREPFEKDYAFTPGVMSNQDRNKDFKILEHSTNFNQDLIGKLERGAYASVRYYINPVSFKPNVNRVFKANDYVKNTPTLGERIMSFFKFDKSDKDIGDLPSRIFTAMLDVGTIERDADDKGWDDASERNADPARIHAQSMMMYNNIFNSQVIDTLIPLNTNLSAGSIIRCEFPRVDRQKRKEPDPELSGLYMVKELCHYFDASGSYSKLKLVRDTFGRK